MPKTSKQKTDTRKALLTAAALRDGWEKYSTALTDWIHGRARLVRVDELRAQVARGKDGTR